MSNRECVLLVVIGVLLTCISFMIVKPETSHKSYKCDNATLKFKKVGVWMHDVDLNCPEGAVIRTIQDSKGNFVIYSIEGICG